MNKVLALIMAGGTGDRLSILSEERAKPAVVFGGKYRIIDLTLSNCVNSGIDKVGVLTQYQPRSLNDHIGIGRPWDLDRAGGGIFLLQPYSRREATVWYMGTADAVRQNLHFVEEWRGEQVLILAGDHVYKMYYNDMFAFHKFNHADVTVGVVEVPGEETSRYGIVTLDSDGLMVDFAEKPESPKGNLVSMGIYIFNKDVLIDVLTKRHAGHDFGHDIVPAMLGKVRVCGYRFEGYWRDIGTIEAYWQANMDLLVELPQFNLYDPEIRTKPIAKPPAKIGPRAYISRSLICDGCIINGYVEHSVLSPGVYVEEGAVVRDSIIFNDTRVESNAAVNYSILDKEVVVCQGCQVGYGDDYTPNREEPQNLNTGINLVGKRTRFPDGLRLGRNCKIYPNTSESDFPGSLIASGETVRPIRPIRPRRKAA